MSIIKRQVRQAHQSGVFVYATVEELNLGLATVRLISTGARLTNLPVIGGEIVKGQRVIIDYASGTSPRVRAVQVPLAESPSVLPDAPVAKPAIGEVPVGGAGVRVSGVSDEIMSPNVWYDLSWTSLVYDTTDGYMYSSGEPKYIALPYVGAYMWVLDIAWDATTYHFGDIETYSREFWISETDPETHAIIDHWDINEATLRSWNECYNVQVLSETNGVIDVAQSNPIESKEGAVKWMQASGIYYIASPDRIYAQVMNNFASSTHLFPSADPLVPKFTVQWINSPLVK